MNKKVIIILIIVAVIIFGCCGGGFVINLFSEDTETNIKSLETTLTTNSTTTAAAKQTNTPKPTIKILKLTAVELSKEYQKNEIKANNLYKDKNVEIEGQIDSITESDFLVNTVLIRLKGYNYNGISCIMKSRKGLENYNIGDKVIIIGKIDGINIFDVTISDCEMSKNE